MRWTIGLLTMLAVLACSESFKPTVDNVAGNYSLRSLTTTTDTGGTVEWVTAGATWSMTLDANGTTTGQLFIPGANQGGGDFTADMAGTWTLIGRTIEFDQTADSFVRDMPFTASENRLTGDHTFSDVRIRLTLMK